MKIPTEVESKYFTFSKSITIVFIESSTRMLFIISSRNEELDPLVDVIYGSKNITANSVKKLLEGTYGDSKVDAIKTIAPKMATQMNSFDVLSIILENLGNYLIFRMIQIRLLKIILKIKYYL